MKFLNFITDTNKVIRIRSVARAVVFNNNKKIPLIYSEAYNFHKLPGGKIEKHESRIRALKRELLEEVGCSIFSIKKIGVIAEYHKKTNLFELSYNYIALQKGDLAKTDISQLKNEYGSKIVWVSLNSAISLLKKDRPTGYRSKFSQKRDLIILNKAKELLASF